MASPSSLGITRLPRDDTPPPRCDLRRLSTRDLFAGGREIEIEHNGEIYCLRITQRGRLILTK
jgi:hemin uptake protein HemP